VLWTAVSFGTSQESFRSFVDGGRQHEFDEWDPSCGRQLIQDLH
jgi:hypothetical protein